MPRTDAAETAGWWAVLLLVLIAAVPVALATRRVLVALPEPPEPEGKVPYAQLPSGRFVATCAVLAAVGALIVGRIVPVGAWPLWWVLCGPALVLVAVDARTTWMPLRLTRLCWVLGGGAAMVTSLLGGWPTLVRVAVGAMAAGLVYLAFWRLSRRQIGYGDVRLAPLLGAAGAAISWPMLFVVVFGGTLVGAVVGLVGALRRGARRPFAYAPSMLAGAFVACLWRALSG